MIIRILLSLALTLALTGLSGQPYTTGEYTVPSLSKQEVRSIIRDRSRLRKKVEELKLTNTRLNNYINSLKGQMSTLNAKGEKTAADRLELVRLNAKYMNLITQLESNVTTLKLLLATAEKKVEALEGVLAELREEIEVHKNTLAALQEKLDHFKEKATALEIELLYREAELTFLERSFSVASIDVFRIQRGKAVSVGRNKYKRGLRRKDAIEIHLWAYTFDETFIEAKRGKGVLTFYLPDGRTKKVRTMFSPAKNRNAIPDAV